VGKPSQVLAILKFLGTQGATKDIFVRIGAYDESGEGPDERVEDANEYFLSSQAMIMF
jgi:hypothetical protein